MPMGIRHVRLARPQLEKPRDKMARSWKIVIYQRFFFFT